MMIQTSEGKLLTAAEVSERLGVTPQQVRTLIRLGRLPAVKHGRDWYVNAADLALVKDRPKTGRPPAKSSKK
jgi:excisionase family DNA binding protein